MVHQVGDHRHFRHEWTIYLDGSGGKATRDPRIRSCGWAWISTQAHISEGEVGEYGSLAGNQTVPRAEHRALHKFLQFIEEKEFSDQNYKVYTDSKVTFKNWDNINRVLKDGTAGTALCRLLPGSGRKE